MPRAKGFLKLAALVVLLALLVAPGQSWGQSLVKAYGSPHIFWVDPSGLRHHVGSWDLKESLFGDTAVVQIPFDQLAAMPEGDALTYATLPSVYRRRHGPRYFVPGRVDVLFGGPPIFSRARHHAGWRSEPRFAPRRMVAGRSSFRRRR